MRLGQLSRQLEVSSDKIVKVLADNFREVNNHPNIKITEEELAFLVVHFAPVQTKTDENSSAEVLEETPVSDTDSPTEQVEEETKDVPEFVESLRPQVITLEEEFNAQKEDLESYKAEKVELEGLKVVGKIELPEPPVKKEKPAPEKKEEESEEIKSFKRKPRRNGRRNGNRKPRLNPVEYQRQKEERLAKKKKEQEELRQKELKKKHYESQVKSKQQAPKKKKKKAVIEIQQKASAAPQSRPKRSGSPIKRFWKWLNGEYDKR